MKILRFLLIILFFQYCSTIEFIPDTEIHGKLQSNMTRWEDIEILVNRPKKPFKLNGTMYIRDYEKNLNFRENNKLKKELYKLGFDGIWLVQMNQANIPPIVIQTQNSQGITVAVYNAKNEVFTLKGYPFRYKE